MQQIATHVRQAGGVLHKQDLVALGASDRMLTAAVRSGRVHRARRGWYTTFPPGDARHEAVRIGGRLTGASLLALLGAWMWTTTPTVTVVVPPGASRLRPRRGATVRWRADGRVPPRTLHQPVLRQPDDDEHAVEDARRAAWAVPLRTALVDAVVAAPLDEAVALLDWALSSGNFSLAGLHAAFVAAPSDVRGVVDWADPLSESFIESVTRATFVGLGHRVESQVRVGPGDRRRVDVVVDEVVALELDGRSSHADTFDADRMKDLAITIRGRTALRASYEMVRDHRPLVVEAVQAVLEEARRPRRPLLVPSGRAQHPGVRHTRGRRPWHLVRPAPGHAAGLVPPGAS
ncbi:type IV toxin-antitoxin system AbiEi family antitoxin domain-containing protein [Frigoribacterium sp. PhB24]|uniref:type IV toxin-antitoxin system AbiEi family antitoxin domain-containing protein n=1 Tax=Frigoribacterium sp. PhB24 TaxID=2485204 RepID=UPI000FA8A0FA|nr:type IV toxin-antitoxin system AbiEi family antitoxin domain-containing protein [Frigoribacterium sp. PhB24]ROS51500.1 very-short-patch-repair endonuclease [Frigoribacterium sp. PhB24]